MKENLYTPECIRTFTGKYMNVFEPTLEMICIEDIAHALSNLCRYGGHTPKFYSVAQHSFICSKIIDKQYRLSALLHDASEAYLLDIPSPIKNQLPDYKILEDNLMSLIAQKFVFNYPLDPVVKGVDRHMLEVEWQAIILNNPSYTPIPFWTPAYAKERFIAQFEGINKHHLEGE